MTDYEIKTLLVNSKVAFWTMIGAVGTILVVVYAVYKEKFLIWLNRPIFKSFFSMSSPYVTKNNFISDFHGLHIESVAYCYHLEIENDGKETAKNCIGSLQEIYQKKGDKYHKLENYIPMSLRWVREDWAPTSISHGQKKYLDIGYVQRDRVGEDKNYIFVFFFDGFSDIDYLSNGLYRLKIVVYSENAENLPIWLDIDWKGVWQEDEIRMKRELTISITKKIGDAQQGDR